MQHTDSDSDSGNTMTFSEDTTQALIGSMECQIEQLKDEVKQLNDEVLKLKLKIQTFQSIIKSDILENIFILL